VLAEGNCHAIFTGFNTIEAEQLLNKLPRQESASETVENRQKAPNTGASIFVPRNPEKHPGYVIIPVESRNAWWLLDELERMQGTS
jgi:hypothetical protein